MARMRKRGEMYTESWSGNLKENGHLEPTRIFGKVILKLILKKKDARKIWSRIERECGLF